MIYKDNSQLKELINHTIDCNGLKKTWIAEQLGISRQQLANILNKQNITCDDMKNIFNVIGYDLIVDLKKKE